MTFFDRLKAATEPEWRAYTEHQFTNAMADGTLSQDAFRHYLVQDYLFLIEFARAYALAVYKAPSVADMREAAAGMAAILDVELNLHVKLCAGWGLTPDELESAQPAAEMLAYTRYVLDTGMRGDLLSLQVALSPCIAGYAEIGKRLSTRASVPHASNPYNAWIAEYSGEDYQDVAQRAISQMDRLAERYASPYRERELIEIFRAATNLEVGFWEMGWRLQASPGSPRNDAS